MKPYFNVIELSRVFDRIAEFTRVATESIPVFESLGRILAQSVSSPEPLPEFARAAMDGYALRAESTFGATESNPAYLTVTGSVAMGQVPPVTIQTGEACRIATGGMLPEGADSVIMVEYTAAADETTIEVYRRVAPGQHVLDIGEDIEARQTLLRKGQVLRPQEIGLLAAIGRDALDVYRKPTVAIISTGDEIVPVHQTPKIGQIRDVNTFTLAAMATQIGATPIPYGIVADNPDDLDRVSRDAVASADMILISGGSSVGTRDHTIEVIQGLADATVFFHGVYISTGKPTLLAKVQNKAVWGLPGQVTSAMVVFDMLVAPYLRHIAGSADPLMPHKQIIPARLTRNVASAQGRTDFVRVKLSQQDGLWWAEPILGKSGLIHTMVKADGYVQIGANTEGLESGAAVDVLVM